MTLAAQDVEYLRALLARNSGNRLAPSHDYLFESRLQHLIRARGLSSVAQLVAALRSAPDSMLERSVAEAMTINETSFFREPAAFDLLRDSLLPALIERRRATRTLRFWSAACSSGQEAYSLAMLLREDFPQLASWSIDILGTDVAAGMIARRRGMGSPTRTAQPVPVSASQSLHVAASAAALRRDFSPQRAPLLSASDAEPRSADDASIARTGRHPVSRRERVDARQFPLEGRAHSENDLVSSPACPLRTTSAPARYCARWEKLHR